jgi:anti-anti-sigma factor
VAVRDHELVAFEGEWDISRAPEFARLGGDALARCEGGLLILDFGAATFADASTVGAIHVLSLEAFRRGIKVAVVCPEGLVGRVFELCRLSALVPVAGAVEAASAMFRAGKDAGSPPRDTDVDEASEHSFPASDPPSYGSAEPDGG